jgi:DNA polymerase-4
LAGVHTAMPVSLALKLCRDLVVVQGNEALYRRAARAVGDHLRYFSPLCETENGDEAYLDLTGVQRLFGRAVDVGARLQREITDRFRLESTIGVASNKLVSKVASSVAGAGRLCDVAPGDEPGFLAPLPVGKLPGVGPSTENRLWDFNIETIKELAATDRALLERVFGRRGRLLHAHAQGLDDTPVGTPRLPKSVEHDVTLDHESNDRNALTSVLFGCVEIAASRLRMLGLMARNVAVRIQYVDGTHSRCATALEHPTDLDREIQSLAASLLQQCRTRRLSVRRIGLRLYRLSHHSPQLGLFASERGYDRKRALMDAPWP